MRRKARKHTRTPAAVQIKNSSPGRKQRTKSDSELIVFLTTQQRERTLCCSFCSSNGYLRLRCPTYDTLEKRIERAKVLGLCFNCFSRIMPQFAALCLSLLARRVTALIIITNKEKRRESEQETISLCIIAENISIHEEPKIITSENT